MELRKIVHCHPMHCSMFRNTKICSPNCLSTALSICIRIILVNPLDVVDNRVAFRQLLQSDRSPFFAIIATSP